MGCQPVINVAAATRPARPAPSSGDDSPFRALPDVSGCRGCRRPRRWFSCRRSSTVPRVSHRSLGTRFNVWIAEASDRPLVADSHESSGSLEALRPTGRVPWRSGLSDEGGLAPLLILLQRTDLGQRGGCFTDVELAGDDVGDEPFAVPLKERALPCGKRTGIL